MYRPSLQVIAASFEYIIDFSFEFVLKTRSLIQHANLIKHSSCFPETIAGREVTRCLEKIHARNHKHYQERDPHEYYALVTPTLNVVCHEPVEDLRYRPSTTEEYRGVVAELLRWRRGNEEVRKESAWVLVPDISET